jgi:ADP-ribosylation factor protein 1
MGGLVSVFRPEKRPLLLAGLEGVGKTTILLGLKRLLDPDQSVQPTVPGSTYECATCGNLTITVMTVSPLEEKIRPLLRHFYQALQGVVFVVDSGDRDSVGEAATLLQAMLSVLEPEVPLLVLANKQDLPHAMTVVEIVEQLGLAAYSGRRWHVQATCATARQGLEQGINWLFTTGWASS